MKKKQEEKRKEELSEQDRRQIFSKIFSQLRKGREELRYALVSKPYLSLFTIPLKYGIDPSEFTWLESLRVGVETDNVAQRGRLSERALVVGSETVRKEEEKADVPASVEEKIKSLMDEEDENE